MKKTKVTKRIAVVLLILTAGVQTLCAQTESPVAKDRSYNRTSGFFIRPELYGALGTEFGYQFGSNFQISGGPAVELDLANGDAYPEIMLGVRAYASKTKWTAFFDYHISLLFGVPDAVIGHRFAAGPSYKNLDFGLGIVYANYYWAPVFTVGYHFRLNRNQ